MEVIVFGFLTYYFGKKFVLALIDMFKNDKK